MAVPAEFQEASGDVDVVPPTLRDGYEVHLAALRHGMNVVLYPRQVLIASPPNGGPELAFVHGVPQMSTLSAVTYAQDKRMRRELLERAGLPVPEGATFAIGRDRRQARQFARRIGYPVVVKPAVGDNMSEVFPGIQDEQQLDAAIDYLRTPEAKRSTFSRTAYGLTLLLEPAEEDGRVVAPPGYRFLLERHVHGEYLRLLVLGGRVHLVLSGPSRLGRKACLIATDEVHPSILSLAIEAANVIPGLALAAVNIVLTDHKQPASEQPLWIVEFSERPSLATAASVDPTLSGAIGNAILSAQAAERNIALRNSTDRVEIDFQIEGATHADGVAAAISSTSMRRALMTDVHVTDLIEGTVEGTIQGSAGQVVAVFESLLDGQLDGQRGMFVQEHHRRM